MNCCGDSIKEKSGKGVLNKIVNNLPIELHVPGYQYCGPGTKLAQRLARGDPGINPLDSACKEHDIAYSENHENLSGRHVADSVLADEATKRVFAKDASISEKLVAWAIAQIMKIKQKAGMSLKNRKSGKGLKIRKTRMSLRKRKSGGGCKKRRVGKGLKRRETGKKKYPLRKIVMAAKKNLVGAINPFKSALKNAREELKNVGGKRYIRQPRILPVPTKVGGILPLIPIFAGLSALGALAGGTAGIVKAVNETKAAKEELAELKRHNETIESIALGKGLYLKPYRTGLGLHMTKN